VWLPWSDFLGIGFLQGIRRGRAQWQWLQYSPKIIIISQPNAITSHHSNPPVPTPTSGVKYLKKVIYLPVLMPQEDTMVLWNKIHVVTSKLNYSKFAPSEVLPFNNTGRNYDIYKWSCFTKLMKALLSQNTFI